MSRMYKYKDKNEQFIYCNCNHHMWWTRKQHSFITSQENNDMIPITCFYLVYSALLMSFLWLTIYFTRCVSICLTLFYFYTISINTYYYFAIYKCKNWGANLYCLRVWAALLSEVLVLQHCQDRPWLKVLHKCKHALF